MEEAMRDLEDLDYNLNESPLRKKKKQPTRNGLKPRIPIIKSVWNTKAEKD